MPRKEDADCLDYLHAELDDEGLETLLQRADPSITTLVANDNRSITKVPKLRGRFNAVCNVFLIECRIQNPNVEDLPEEITKLSMTRNEISVMPNLNTFSALRYLWFCSNNIQTLSDLSCLERLIELNITGNFLSVITGDLLPSSLKLLRADKNAITSITKLDRLVNLRKLYLSDNNIKEWDQNIPRDLEEFSLLNNPVREISGTVIDNLEQSSFAKLKDGLSKVKGQSWGFTSRSTARVILGQVLRIATCGTRTYRGDSL